MVTAQLFNTLHTWFFDTSGSILNLVLSLSLTPSMRILLFMYIFTFSPQISTTINFKFAIAVFLFTVVADFSGTYVIQDEIHRVPKPLYV